MTRPQQDIGHLLSLASTSLALLALPQTDAPDAGLPEGDERSEHAESVQSGCDHGNASLKTVARSGSSGCPRAARSAAA